MTLTRRKPPHGRLPPSSAEPLTLGRLGQNLRLVWRTTAIAAWTLPLAAVQAVLIRLPGNAKRRLPLLFWSGVARTMGIERRVLGTMAHRTDGRAILFVANHTSWLDIPTLGGVLPGCFVSKAEVAGWPVIRTIAYLGRTVFVSRRARETSRERDDMRSRMQDGDNLVLFPEGTSSDGARVLPFRSPFFAAAEPGDGAPPLIQPVSIVYDRLDGLAMWRATRAVSSWYGDMDLGSHFWRLAGHRRLRATILLHPVIDPAHFASRKDLARAVWTTVTAASATLRQGRPVTVDSLDRKPPVIGTVEAA